MTNQLRIPYGNDFKLRYVVTEPTYVDDQTIFEDFDLTKCTHIKVFLNCEKHDINIPLKWEIEPETINVIIADVKAKTLEVGSSYGMTITGCDENGKAFRWKLAASEGFSIIDATNGAELGPTLMDFYDVNAKIGLVSPTGPQGVQGVQGTTGVQGEAGIGFGIDPNDNSYVIDRDVRFEGNITGGDYKFIQFNGPITTTMMTNDEVRAHKLKYYDSEGEEFHDVQTEIEYLYDHIAPQGDQGVQGDIGNQGEQGDQGIKGDKGVQGDQGDRGEKGVQGNQGEQGNQGMRGEKGVQGDGGVQGDLGKQGQIGNEGPQGDKGVKGDQGNIGMQGDQGDAGIGFVDRGLYYQLDKKLYFSKGTGITIANNNGALYLNPDNLNDGTILATDYRFNYHGNDTSIISQLDDIYSMGVQGPQGDRGADGYQGRDGDNGPQGDKGVQGNLGNQGDQGPRGEKGVQGDQGDRGERGLNGARGYDGQQGNKGDKGVQGDKGDQGQKGEQGAQGRDGSVNFDDLTPEQKATLKGDQGPQGVQGIQGDKGFQGFVGDRGYTGYQGDKGDRGNQGEIGAQGYQGNIGNQGNKGNDGDVAFEDLTPSQIEMLRGQQGYQGNIGIQGYQGTQGNSIRMLQMTQAQYDNIQPKDPNVLYIIKN